MNNKFVSYNKNEISKMDKAKAVEKKQPNLSSKQKSFKQLWYEGKKKEFTEKKQALDDKRNRRQQRIQQKQELKQLKEETSYYGRAKRGIKKGKSSAIATLKQARAEAKSLQKNQTKPKLSSNRLPKNVNVKGKPQYIVIKGAIYKKVGNDVQFIGANKKIKVKKEKWTAL